jgi:hypothetical protein
MNSNHRARLIAYYLPQFHPIPENDEWWGRGFTEWMNVAKAKPLFRGHYQPHIPADLGFYDLRVPETRTAQAEMAGEYGIEGFCYWHYWFAGKRLLERPFNEVLKSGQPKLPFCLGWANESWTGIWHGFPDRLLMEQTYPGEKDEELHFYEVLRAFSDERYITVDGLPLFIIFNPQKLPEPLRFIDHWRELAIKSGLKGIYFVGNTSSMNWIPKEHGFDALIPHNPGMTAYYLVNPLFGFADNICNELTGKTFREVLREKYKEVDLVRHIGKVTYLLREKFRKVNKILYEDYIKKALLPLEYDYDAFPCVVPNWDNTPRCGINGYILYNSTPEMFKRHLREAINQILQRPLEKRIIFIKSWNEWAEGNHLEPDLKFGKEYLKACRDEIFYS